MRMKFFTLFLCLLTFGALTITSCDKEESLHLEEQVQQSPDFKNMTEAELQAYLQTPEMTQTPEEDRTTDLSILDEQVIEDGLEVGYERKQYAKHIKAPGSNSRSIDLQVGVDPLDATPGTHTFVVQQRSAFGSSWQTLYVGWDDNVAIDLPAIPWGTQCQSMYEWRVRTYSITGCNDLEVVFFNANCQTHVMDTDVYGVDGEDWAYFRTYRENAGCTVTDRAVRPNNCQGTTAYCSI